MLSLLSAYHILRGWRRSVEAWVWVYSWQDENNVLQWGARGGSSGSGNAAGIGVGYAVSAFSMLLTNFPCLERTLGRRSQPLFLALLTRAPAPA